MLYPPSDFPVPLDPNVDTDKAVLDKLRATLGGFFTDRIQGDSAWARGILADDASVLL